jgi:hypothetical protein
LRKRAIYGWKLAKADPLRQEKENWFMVEKEKQAKEEKPLDRMTAKELREMALKIPEITGVHAMNKAELLAAIKKERGVVDETTETKKSDVSTRQIKEKIHALKTEKAAAHENKDKAKAKILRRRRYHHILP